MPIYEFHCQACEESFEILTTASERNQAHKCPACDSGRTAVQVSSFSALGSQLPVAEAPAPPTQPQGGCCGGTCCG